MITKFKIFENNENNENRYCYIYDEVSAINIVIDNIYFEIVLERDDEIEISSYDLFSHHPENDKDYKKIDIFDYYENVNKELIEEIYLEILKNPNVKYIEILRDFLEQIPEVKKLGKINDFNL